MAFVLLDEGWIGGVHYLLNLVSALDELPGHPVQPLLLVGPGVSAGTLEKFHPFLAHAPLLCDRALVREARLPVLPLLRLRAEPLEALLRANGAEVLFHQGLMVGSRFSVPTLGWIPDFQHRRLPRMFGAARFLRRELLFQFLVDESTRLMVSSEAARMDGEALYPRSRGRVTAVPFAIRPVDPSGLPDQATLQAKYGLPDRYVFLPNQFWRHKNHLAVVEALRRMPQGPVVVATGSLHDQRDPQHPAKVQAQIRRYALEARFRLLGQIPYADVLGLLRGAQGLLNPSLFEGWSTPVEEAKAYGIPMLLSDLAVHREQAQGLAQFFDSGDPDALARVLREAWETPLPTQRTEAALEAYRPSRRRFAEAFGRLAQRCREEGA